MNVINLLLTGESGRCRLNDFTTCQYCVYFHKWHVLLKFRELKICLTLSDVGQGEYSSMHNIVGTVFHNV